jgi:hypothetical protein
MNEDYKTSIFSSAAMLWDGKNQLSGILELWETKITFLLNDFQSSHLHLSIPLNSIENVEEFLVFNIAKVGLKIINRNGQFDLFVLEEGNVLKKMILTKIENV